MSYITRYFIIILVALLFTHGIQAQSVPGPADKELYNATRHHADSLLYNAKDYRQAATVFRTAAGLSPRDKPENLYNAACSWSLANEKDSAFLCLSQSIESGWTDLNLLENDKDLNNLHYDARWEPVVIKLSAKIAQGKAFYLWGAYFGLLLILFFHNLFLYFSLRETSFLWYSVVIFFWMGLETSRTPEFGLYISDNLFYWVKLIKPLSGPDKFYPCIVTVFSLLFVRNFLNLKQTAKGFNTGIIALIVIFIIMTFLSLFFDFMERKIVFPAFILAYLYSFIAGIYCWRKGYKAARFFVIGFIFFFSGLVWSVLTYLGPLDISLRYLSVFTADNIGTVTFFAMLSLALGDKIKILKKEKENAQEKALEVLEERVEERTAEVVQQKKIIEKKNQDITDSINYAQLIQQAMLPVKSEIATLLPQSFILFKPKDIVSGDFYFFRQEETNLFIAAVDCTGHGVPGAFMSMISSEKLNDAVQSNTDPSQILMHLNKGIKASLRQTNHDRSSRDGMDIALCALNPKNLTLRYAGANRPLWLIRKDKNEIEEFKATKKSIGGFTEASQHYETHEIQLQPGDTFYIFSDGYADTFSGLTDKKLTTKKFKELLLEARNLNMEQQGEYLNTFVEKWKGSLEQTDDILVIGVRVG